MKGLESLSYLRSIGYLSPLDVHFARTLERITGGEAPRVSLAAALLSRQVAQGHVCLDMAAFCQAPPRLFDPEGDAKSGPVPFVWPELMPWLSELARSAAVGPPDATTPLVFCPPGRLYLRRYFEHERILCHDILGRLSCARAQGDGADSELLDRLFASGPPGAGRSAQLQLDVGPIDPQRRAVETALGERFCVITGGPGTGKTSTVVKILALHVARALRAGLRPLRVHLLAPTGKAAARLSEAISSARAKLACDPEIRAAIPAEATTIHRALGARPGQAVGFAHDADHPLATDVVVVDEASMVDLSLMRRLMSAIPQQAHVVLLGDRDQLASVEAGAVLGDVCGAGLSRDERSDKPLARCQVHLTRSYRYAARSGIGRLAEAIRRGDVPAALKVLEGRRLPDATLVNVESETDPLAPLLEQAIAAYGRLSSVATPEQGFAALSRYRVLCANRRGPLGVERVNAAIGSGLAAAAGSPSAASAIDAGHGRPIIVEHNDYQLRVFNGDVGLLLPDREGQLRAFFADGEAFVRLSPKRLPAHSSVYAMSVHKSQGSEMDHVAVVLPRLGSPLLTRELLYTAVTRARKRVTLFASPEAVAAAIETGIRRDSGLRDRLWGRTGDVVTPVSVSE
ncbi:MAG: exodeoxyribonuclease V subunit alpha [Myxococcales bacterium]|nr:exodeoxyribonuclease V subunit alpha [Myxococcales bacterium]